MAAPSIFPPAHVERILAVGRDVQVVVQLDPHDVLVRDRAVERHVQQVHAFTRVERIGEGAPAADANVVPRDPHEAEGGRHQILREGFGALVAQLPQGRASMHAG